MPVIPSNKLQRRQIFAEREAVRANPFAEKKVLAIVAEVYDAFAISSGKAPEHVIQYMKTKPGAVFVKVVLLNGKQYDLKLGVSPDERHLLYGNAAAIIGRPAYVKYYGSDISKGIVFLSADDLNPIMSEDEACSPFDIFMASI